MRVTLEIELDVDGEDLFSIARGLNHAATNVGTWTVRRKGLGMYFFDSAGRDIGCMMPWAAARDWLFIEGNSTE